DKIMASPAGKHVEAISPTVEVFGMLQFKRKDRTGQDVVEMKEIKITGVDPAKHARVGGFSQYLRRQKDDPNPSFELTPEARERVGLNRALEFAEHPPAPAAIQPRPALFPDPVIIPQNPLAPPPDLPLPKIDPLPPPKPVGIILGYSLAHYRYPDPV